MRTAFKDGFILCVLMVGKECSFIAEFRGILDIIWEYIVLVPLVRMLHLEKLFQNHNWILY